MDPRGAGNDTIDVSGLTTTSTAFNDLRTGAIWLWGEGGDDVLRTSTDSTITQLVYGGDGNDQLYSMAAAGSAAFVSYLDPGAGDDQIYSGPANDLMLGSTGSDTFFFDTNGFLGSDEIGELNNDLSANDVDTINVSANTDVTWVTLSYTDWQSINPSNLALKLIDANGIENFIGGCGGGSILGNSRDNVLTAGPGIYGINGYDGNDTIIGNTGDDYLVGGNGDDTIDGGAGNNGLYGEDGNDSLYTLNNTNDYIDGGSGTNVLWTHDAYDSFANVQITGINPSVSGSTSTTAGAIYDLTPSLGSIGPIQVSSWETDWGDGIKTTDPGDATA